MQHACISFGFDAACNGILSVRQGVIRAVSDRAIWFAPDGAFFDDHGALRVQRASWRTSASATTRTRFGRWSAGCCSPELEAFLAKHGRTSTSWMFNKALRYREGVLEAGETVAVCGTGTREVDPDPRAAAGGYRENAMRLVLTAGGGLPLYVSDDIDALR